MADHTTLAGAVNLCNNILAFLLQVRPPVLLQKNGLFHSIFVAFSEYWGATPEKSEKPGATPLKSAICGPGGPSGGVAPGSRFPAGRLKTRRSRDAPAGAASLGERPRPRANSSR